MVVRGLRKQASKTKPPPTATELWGFDRAQLPGAARATGEGDDPPHVVINSKDDMRQMFAMSHTQERRERKREALSAQTIGAQTSPSCSPTVNRKQ